METYLTHITDYLLTQSWQIALLVVVIAAVSLVLRNKSAHVRYLLWLIVLAKCLAPPLLTVPLAILPQEKPAVVFEVVGTTISEPLELLSAPVKTAPAPMVRERPTKFNIHKWLGAGWIMGTAVFLIFNLLKAVRTNYWLWRKRKALSAELLSDIEKLFSAHGIKSLPGIWQIDGISQPFVWGLLRGSIYLPANFLNIKKPEHQKSVLGHELSHVIRFDAAVNFLQVIAQAIFWFHPFVWWANKKIRAEREKCCDEMAIARLNALPKDYSTAILETLAAKHERTRPVPSLAVAGTVKNVEERIRTMLRPGKKFYKRPSLIAATVVLLVALLTVPTALVLTARAGTKAATYPLHQAAKDGEIEQIKSLLSKGANVNAKDGEGRTPLHHAAIRGSREMTSLLLASGAGIGRSDNYSRRPLHLAALQGHMAVAELLLANGSPADAVSKLHETPLHLAACAGHKNMAELLISKGADVNTKDRAGQTTLFYAARGGHRDLAELLITKGTDVNAKDEDGWTPLRVTARRGHRDLAELLLAKGADVNEKDEYGWRPLHMVAIGGHREVAELLLAKGADVDTKTKDGYTALHGAAVNGRKDVMELLIAKGANFNAKDRQYGTPLHLAAMVGSRRAAEFLLTKGADVNAKKENGQTPLHSAAEAGHKNLIELLLTKGADVKIKDKDGKSPLALAKEKDHQEIVELLRKHGAKE